jgi:hypothetical protein
MEKNINVYTEPRGQILLGGSKRSRCNRELHKLYNEPGIVKMIKLGRLKLRGQLFRMQEQKPYRKLTIYEPEGARRVGRPAVRWLESAEDLKKMSVRNCRRKSQGTGQMASSLKIGRGLLCTAEEEEEEEDMNVGGRII